jgi:hypothetical protein
MLKEGKGFGAQFLKLDKPSYTIPARYWKDGYDALVYYNENSIRRLTILELQRIQTFPDTYEFVGSNKDIIIQIGNAVAVNFAYEISKHIIHMLNLTTNESQIQNENESKSQSESENEITDYNKFTVANLKILCKEKNLKLYSKLKKSELIELLSKN